MQFYYHRPLQEKKCLRGENYCDFRENHLLIRENENYEISLKFSQRTKESKGF